MDAEELYKLAGHILREQGEKYDEDMVQELVLYGLRSLELYKEGNGTKESTYVYKGMEMKYKMLKRLQRAKKRYYLEQTVSEFDEQKYGAEDRENANSIIDKIYHLIGKETYLHFFKGWKFEKIAKKEGVSRQAICQRVQKNIEQIKKYLGV